MAERPIYVYVGTYTPEGRGGIHIYQYDRGIGKLTLAHPVLPVQDPSYLVISRNRRFLYSVMETEQFGSRTGGAVASYEIDVRNGALRELNRQATGGRKPCHLAVDSGNTTLVASNYGEGTATVFPLAPDGRIAPAVCTLRHQGSGANPERQEGPHVHCAAFSPDEKVLCLVDLGVDAVVPYRFSARSGDVSAAEADPAGFEPGAGPRHIVFHPNGRFAYVVTELSDEVVAFRYGPTPGAFEPLQTISTLPAGFRGTSYCAAIHLSPDGRTLYASNRGHDSVAVFHTDAETGRLEAMGHAMTGGNWPRDFAVDPAGRFLLAANERSDTIKTFAIANNGMPEFTGLTASLPQPTCVCFVELG